MSFFDDLEVENLGLDEDKIGGSFAKIDKTGFYEMTIEKAYVGESSGGAKSVTVVLVADNKAKLTSTEYISSGREKGCKTYYLDKDGNKKNLPGYSKIKGLDALLTNTDKAYPNVEKGTVSIYDKDLKTEVPTEKLVIKDWIGKKIGVLVKKKLEDKYGEEHKPREVYEVEHYIDSKTGKTRNEIVAGKSGFKNKWLATFNEDYVLDIRDKSKNYVAPTSNESDVVPDDSPF